MREPRLFVDIELRPGMSLELPAASVRHAAQVLRLRSGDPVRLFNGLGGEFTAQIDTFNKMRLSARIGEHYPIERESPLRIVLGQGISRGERMDYTIQKAVELGVQRIVPLSTERSMVKLDAERAAKRHAHWHNVILSASEQCGRNTIAELGEVTALQTWLEDASQPLTRVVLRGDAGTSLNAISVNNSAVLLAGPEGGLATTEWAAAEAAGFHSVSLGPRVLRTETAAVAAISALQTLFGDFR